MRPKETISEASEISVNETMRAALEERAQWSGIACDACDIENARVAVVLRYYDAPDVRARLCLDCYGQHMTDAARLPETTPDAAQTPGNGITDAPAQDESRTAHCEVCNAPTSFERTSEKQPREGEVCETCGTWVCVDCKRETGCKDCATPAPTCEPCGASGVDLLSGMCGDCHKNNAQKSNAHVDETPEDLNCAHCGALSGACHCFGFDEITPAPNVVECELCTNVATQRVRFRGVMTLTCDACAQDIRTGKV